MADEESEIELSHLSWHPESSILSSNPRAWADREASTTNRITLQSPSIGDSEGSPPSVGVHQRGRLAPSAVHRTINTADAGSGTDSSGLSGETLPSQSGQPVANPSLQPFSPATPNPSVSVDERLRHIAQVVRQDATTPASQAQAHKARINLRQEAGKKVQPTIEALRAWYDASESQRVVGLQDTALWDSLTGQVQRLHRPGLPSHRQLVDLVHHYHPPRGDVPIHVCDFGDGRACHFETTLGNIEEKWQEKPDWATVRWIHAPLGPGLTHSSVEDLFRHADDEPWAFRNVAGPSWPYIACEVISLEHRDSYQKIREVCILANKIKGLPRKLDQTTFTADHNVSLKGDIEWRGKHVGACMGFLDLAQGDIGYQLSDGRGIGYNGPRGGLEYLDHKLDEQVLLEYPFFKNAQIVRTPFRCFHRPDGVLLTMSSMRGVNYIDKDLSSHLQEPAECLFYNDHASVLGQIWKLFSKTGTSSWHTASVEWFLVYLMTEVVCTPHTEAQGHNAPTIPFAYQNIIQGFKRRRFNQWKRGDSIKLVQDYIKCVDELTMLVHLKKKQLDFLKDLKKDCHVLDQDSTGVNNPNGKDVVSRCDWAIETVQENFELMDSMVKDLRVSMVAVRYPAFSILVDT